MNAEDTGSVLILLRVIMISIKVPPLGESIVEATVSRWVKKKGDTLASGDTLVELETDKITVEVPAPRAGVLVSQAVAEGDVVKVDQILGELDESGAAAGASAPPASSPQETPAAPPTKPAPGPTSAPPAGDATKSSPAARREARDAGVSMGDVAGTGRGGVVSKPDVLEHVANAAAEATDDPKTAPSPAGATPQASEGQHNAAKAPTVAVAKSAPAGERETRE